MKSEPLSTEQQQEVVSATHHYIRQASDLYQTLFNPIPVLFDLRGRSAGMYRVRGKVHDIRYNPHHFARHYQINLLETVPHEVAHYIAHMRYGWKRIRPHGREWRGIMTDLGIEPRVSCDYDLSGIPHRIYQTFAYHCGCRAHQLTGYRHNRIHRNQARYYCRSCRGELRPQQPQALALPAYPA